MEFKFNGRTAEESNEKITERGIRAVLQVLILIEFINYAFNFNISIL